MNRNGSAVVVVIIIFLILIFFAGGLLYYSIFRQLTPEASAVPPVTFLGTQYVYDATDSDSEGITYLPVGTASLQETTTSITDILVPGGPGNASSSESDLDNAVGVMETMMGANVLQTSTYRIPYASLSESPNGASHGYEFVFLDKSSVSASVSRAFINNEGVMEQISYHTRLADVNSSTIKEYMANISDIKTALLQLNLRSPSTITN